MPQRVEARVRLVDPKRSEAARRGVEARLVSEACGSLKELLRLLAWAEEGIEYKIGARAMARLCEPELRGVGDVRRRVAVAIRAACGDCGIEVPLERVEGLVPGLI